MHSGLETLTPRMIRVLPTTGRSTLWAAVDIVRIKVVDDNILFFVVVVVVVHTMYPLLLIHSVRVTEFVVTRLYCKLAAIVTI